MNAMPGEPAAAWLLEHDSPGVRYLAMRDLLSLPADDQQLLAARRLAHTRGPIAEVLAQMAPAGYWIEPGPGYSPKYRGTVWALILLAQLGAHASEDERLDRACGYLIDHALCDGGQFTTAGGPSGTADCLQGNLCWALAELGYDHPRLAAAYDWMSRTVTGDGMAPRTGRDAGRRYYAGKCGPDFACGANAELPCAWGAVKVMMAFANAPAQYRGELMERAAARGVTFLLGTDPALAQYPAGYAQKPSGNWWKFGFPTFYVTDLIQLVEALVLHGLGGDPRLRGALAAVWARRDAQGRWTMDYPYGEKTWSDFGPKGQPNPWVTLRALRVVRRAQQAGWSPPAP